MNKDLTELYIAFKLIPSIAPMTFIASDNGNIKFSYSTVKGFDNSIVAEIFGDEYDVTFTAGVSKMKSYPKLITGNAIKK